MNTCPTCTDFKSWTRHLSTTECPADKSELGRSTWTLLHTMAANYPQQPTLLHQHTMHQFLRTISTLYPCTHCAHDFEADMHANPPDLSNRDGFSVWMCERHNMVNSKLGKPQFDCKKVLKRWLWSMADPSCQ
jgi:FAD-linked sulfhydryl oxidase